jgi:hypothetical protein
MCSTGRKVTLITDNAPTKITARAREDEENGHRVFYMSVIKGKKGVVFLPPVTSHVQPLEQGIIASFKAHNCRQLVQFMLDEANNEASAHKTLLILSWQMHEAAHMHMFDCIGQTRHMAPD